MLLSAHFTIEELTASQYASRLGIDNTPPPDVLEHLRASAVRLEDVRRRLGDRPVIISSGYRSVRVNAEVGGVTFPPSAHTLGYAIDFTCPSFGTPFEVAQFLSRQADLVFDQLIYEFGDWVHISFDPRSRQQCLTIRNATEGYVAGIVDLPRLR